jgi:SAM-dependent methyltransferase
MGDEFKERVRERYANAALAARGEARLAATEDSSCCDSVSCCGLEAETAAVEVDMCGGAYSEAEKGELPGLAAGASLGCGNPVVLAGLSPGQVVLDLGSGGGIDVLLSARRVAPGGKAYGLDMTGEMLALARENQREAGVENAEFLEGEIEAVPLPDATVDVVISNCVVNLSTDKPRVLAEAFRVLKPGGRFAVSDVVFLGEKARLPERVVRNVELWSGCISGALEKSEYEGLLGEAGFENISVEVTYTHDVQTVTGLQDSEDLEALREAPLTSAFIRARKPE